MSIRIRDTVQQARAKGCYAAYERITPLCPYSSIYEKELYDAWYDGLSEELRECFDGGVDS